MAKTLIEQYKEIKTKVKEDEQNQINGVLNAFDLMEVEIEKIKKIKENLIDGEMLSQQLSNVLIVFGNVRTLFEQSKKSPMPMVPMMPMPLVPASQQTIDAQANTSSTA